MDSRKAKVGSAICLLILGSCAAQFHSRKVALAQSNVTPTRSLAPEFSLTDLGGKKLKLSSYRGKIVVLDFWATWCTPCRAEIPRLMDLQNKYGDQGLQIIGISLDDDPKAVPVFYRQLKIDYPVAIGDARLAERFGRILGLPVNFVIDRDGRIYAKHAGEVDIRVIEDDIKSLLR
jgi:cytochrome c biogenesis protein CcmG, thiol:disulfide interchange protein DsbE